jgi:GDP-L-fucose synthase
MNKSDRIYVAGHSGLVGSAIMRALENNGFSYIISASSSELDLRDNNAVKKFFKKEKPQYIFLAAAKVGGIMANKNFGAEFIYDNLCIQNNVIHNAYLNKVDKLLFLGSSCIYPKQAAQPIKEEYLLTGKLEPTNAPYAIAKIAGVEMCKAYHAQYGCNFVSAMPTNLYGPNDNYDLETAHVLPTLLRKFYEAKEQNLPEVTIWGTGTPKREFLYSDDAANACLFLMQHYNDNDEVVNIGCGEDITIKELAEAIKLTVGFKGNLVFDTTKPDGTMRKLLDVKKINNIGWKHTIKLEDGLTLAYNDFVNNYTNKNRPKSNV